MTTTADDVWRLLAELAAAQKETERLIQEKAREADQRSQEIDRRFQETERRFQELEHRFQKPKNLIQEQAREADQRSQELERSFQELNKQIDNLGGKWGYFVDNMVAPACETLFVERGITFHQVSQQVKKRLNGKTLEIDVMAINKHHALVVKVRSSLSVDDVKDLIEDLKQFSEFFPEYHQKQLYGAVAGIEIEEGVDKYAYRQGLFVLAQAGENVKILNAPQFEPKAW